MLQAATLRIAPALPKIRRVSECQDTVGRLRATLDAMRMFLLLLGAAAIICGSHPKDADACTCLDRQPTRTVFPESGVEDIPRNARFLVEYSDLRAGAGELLAETGMLELRSPAGAETVLVEQNPEGRQIVTITPQEHLESNTRYALWARSLDCTQFEETCFGEELVQIGSWTTGTQLDEVAPVFEAGAVERSRGVGDLCEGACSCDFDFKSVFSKVVWPKARDAFSGDLVRYEFSLDGIPLAHAKNRRGAFYKASEWCYGLRCEAGYRGDVAASEGMYSITAVDLAGNRTLHTTDKSLLAFDCSLRSNSDNSTFGCSTSKNHGLLASFSLLLILLALRRRMISA